MSEEEESVESGAVSNKELLITNWATNGTVPTKPLFLATGMKYPLKPGNKLAGNNDRPGHHRFKKTDNDGEEIAGVMKLDGCHLNFHTVYCYTIKKYQEAVAEHKWTVLQKFSKFSAKMLSGEPMTL